MEKSLMGTRRTTLELLFEVLRAVNAGSINKTGIMNRCSMSYNQLSRYLTFMNTRNLVHQDDAGRFDLTDKGRRAFDQVSTAYSMLTSFSQAGSSKAA